MAQNTVPTSTSLALQRHSYCEDSQQNYSHPTMRILRIVHNFAALKQMHSGCSHSSAQTPICMLHSCREGYLDCSNENTVRPAPFVGMASVGLFDIQPIPLNQFLSVRSATCGRSRNPVSSRSKEPALAPSRVSLRIFVYGAQD